MLEEQIKHSESELESGLLAKFVHTHKESGSGSWCVSSDTEEKGGVYT